jgi:hypothetical protein
MSQQSFEDYQDLSGTGFQGGGGEATAPEDEFFHSVYISGKTRKNHINIEENEGKFQVRGVEYNLDEVNLVITHTKDILAKIKNEQGRDNIKCFSYKDGSAPWYGTSDLPDGSNRACPLTSVERAANDFCSECRSQILVAGIYCDAYGSPILTEAKKPIFVFIRGKGMKYSNVSEYLNDRFNDDLSPIFEPVTDQSKQFEKSIVNNKRFVTRLTKSTARSSFGNDVNIFELTKGTIIPKEAVMKILKLSKDTLEQFVSKFNWANSRQAASTGYGSRPEGIMEIGEPATSEDESQVSSGDAGQTETQEAIPAEEKRTFSFDDIEF